MNVTAIQTQRLFIKPFTVEHLTPRYVSWLNDPLVVRYSEQRHKKHTVESCHAYMNSFENTPHYFWAIEEIETGMGHIGNINAYIDTNNLIADIGILIGVNDAWNKGYGFEAFEAVCGFLARKETIRKITAGTMSTNLSMLKILEKMNMVPDGQRKRQFLFEDREADLIHMALFTDTSINT
jgi:RimJ/RimL family protein N-acetyltransferase